MTGNWSICFGSIVKKRDWNVSYKQLRKNQDGTTLKKRSPASHFLQNVDKQRPKKINPCHHMQFKTLFNSELYTWIILHCVFHDYLEICNQLKLTLPSKAVRMNISASLSSVFDLQRCAPRMLIGGRLENLSWPPRSLCCNLLQSTISPGVHPKQTSYA